MSLLTSVDVCDGVLVGCGAELMSKELQPVAHTAHLFPNQWTGMKWLLPGIHSNLLIEFMMAVQKGADGVFKGCRCSLHR